MTHLAWIIPNSPVDDDLDLFVGEIAIRSMLGLCLRGRGGHEPERSDTDTKSEEAPSRLSHETRFFLWSTHSIMNIHLQPASPATPRISSSPTARKLVIIDAR